jgi:hypothetical protein
MKTVTNKSQMNSAIKKNAGTKSALLSIPKPVLSKSTSKLNDPAIGNRTTGSRLSSLIGKK